jgi:hypothetical protein
MGIPNLAIWLSWISATYLDRTEWLFPRQTDSHRLFPFPDCPRVLRFSSKTKMTLCTIPELWRPRQCLTFTLNRWAANQIHYKLKPSLLLYLRSIFTGKSRIIVRLRLTRHLIPIFLRWGFPVYFVKLLCFWAISGQFLGLGVNQSATPLAFAWPRVIAFGLLDRPSCRC